MDRFLTESLKHPIIPSLTCNPAYCTSNSPSTSAAPPAEVEAVLLQHFQRTRLNILIEACIFDLNRDLCCDIVTDLASEWDNNTTEYTAYAKNAKVIEKFKIKFKKAVESILERETRGKQLDALVVDVLINQFSRLGNVLQIGASCLCTISQRNIIKKIKDENEESTPDLDACVLSILLSRKPFLQEKMIKVVGDRDWSVGQSQNFWVCTGEQIIEIVRSCFIKHELSDYFKFMDRRMGGIQTYLSSQLVINRGDDVGNMGVQFRLDEVYRMLTLRHIHAPLPAYIKELKERADETAKDPKTILHAILRYSLVNSFSEPNLMKLQSLSNTALLRLRVSTEDPSHLPFAIYECTLALDIDPNHGKALFRRGLALALMKRWDFAIVDFQRAVELDSRSPAAAELRVALRQVTRRIEA